jgi:hypothetical protein
MFRCLLLISVALASVTVPARLAAAGWGVPPQWNPWASLDLKHPLTPVTRWKLQRLGDDPALCHRLLATAPPELVEYTRVPDYEPVPGCPLQNTVRIRQAGVGFNRSFVASCPLAVTWIMYVQHGVQPLARELFGKPVERVMHFGSFACRNIGNAASGRRSEHAAANALDVAGFRLHGGERISVLEHWHGDGAKAEFLQRTFEMACELFGTSLGPEYNAAHADHFHFGVRGRGFCK